MAVQGQWIEGAGFKVKSSDVIRTSIEPFFRKPELAKILSGHHPSAVFPDWQMSQVFNDYVL
jgi:hypothetical protein